MVQELRYCKKCIMKLGKYGNIPLSIYALICEDYANGRSILSKYDKNGKLDYIIHFLEKQKYIVTFEIEDNFVAIKPAGYKKRISRYLDTHEVCAFRTKNKSGDKCLMLHLSP